VGRGARGQTIEAARPATCSAAFQPLAGGTSVAFVGGLGALAVLGRDTTLTRFRVQALVAIPLAILDTVLGDIHGAPYLVCFAIGAVWVVREERVVAARGKRSSRPDRRGRSWA
jgi:hypothetical protein